MPISSIHTKRDKQGVLAGLNLALNTKERKIPLSKDVFLSPPPSRNVEAADVQTGPKLSEHRCWETFGEDISKLGRRWYVKHANVTNNNPFPHKVEINLDMLCALMLNRIGGEVDCTDIVTVDQKSTWSVGDEAPEATDEAKQSLQLH